MCREKCSPKKLYNPYVPGITFLGVHVGALWITPIILALETVRRYYNDLWIFDRYRVIHKKGRLSLTYNQPVVRYSHIRAITVSQSLLGRILNYGSIELGTAAQEDSEMIIAGVVCPRQFGELIDKMRLDIEKNAKKETRSPISMQQYIESKSDETRAASAN